jgi:hypothetical protein
VFIPLPSSLRVYVGPMSRMPTPITTGIIERFATG